MTGLSPVHSLFPILVGLPAAARNSCYRNLKERLPWMQQARKDNNGVLVDFTFPANFQLEAQAMSLWLEDNITCYCPFSKVVHWQPLLCMLSLCCEQCDHPAKFRCFALLDLLKAKLICFFDSTSLQWFEKGCDMGSPSSAKSWNKTRKRAAHESDMHET